MNLAVVNPRTNGQLRMPAGFNTFNSLFDEVLHQMAHPARVQPTAGFLPTADVIETADAYELHLTVPGFRREDLKIDLEQGQLKVSGERKFTPEDGRTYRVAESRYGTFERTFHLPETVDQANISASLDLGILIVRLPKDEQKTAKHQIEIQ